MVNVLGFLGSAPGRSTPPCRTRAVDGSAVPPPAARAGDPGRSAHRAGTSPSLRHRRFRSSESSLREKSKRRATTKRLRNRKLVLWIVPTRWQLPTGQPAVYLTPMVDTTHIDSLEAH